MHATSEMIIAPSLLSANFAHLAQDIQSVEQGGAHWLHLDVMDGHFVPNLTFGPPVIQTLRNHTTLPFDVHLMIEKPEQSLQQYIDAGANSITVHVEACTHLHRTIAEIKKAGIQAGVALNPATSLSTIESILPMLDLVLIMTVNPGFGGQSFIDLMIPKVKQLHQMIHLHKASTIIQVDGGITPQTIASVYQAGARAFVAGSAIFQTSQHAQAIQALIQAARATDKIQ